MMTFMWIKGGGDMEKVAIITGGAHGIGKAMVKGFLKEKIQVAFMDKDKDAGEQVLSEVQNENSECFFYHGDLTKKEDMEDFIESVVDKFGKIDYLVNNACINHHGILSGCTYEEFNQVLQVGVTAPYYLTYLLKDHFKENAAIINISSTRENMSQKDTESYSAAKGGIGSLTHALAMSLSGVARVNTISPGWIDTREDHDLDYSITANDLNQHPSLRVGKTEDVVRLALFLCEEKSGFINGEDIRVDGGMSRRMIYHGDEGWNYEKEK